MFENGKMVRQNTVGEFRAISRHSIVTTAVYGSIASWDLLERINLSPSKQQKVIEIFRVVRCLLAA
jgi:hypothetical protein